MGIDVDVAANVAEMVGDGGIGDGAVAVAMSTELGQPGETHAANRNTSDSALQMKPFFALTLIMRIFFTSILCP